MLRVSNLIDSNERSVNTNSTDVELDLDNYGDSNSPCVNGLNGRKKVLCCKSVNFSPGPACKCSSNTPCSISGFLCQRRDDLTANTTQSGNTPKNLNPFLPVALENIFPTKPPETGFPIFDLQRLGADDEPVTNEDPNQQTFGLVIIDGPSSAVSSLKKRDGSHWHIISCEPMQSSDISVLQIVCMDGSEHSNCRDIDEGGVEGTIVRMPDNCGPGETSQAPILV